MADVNVPKLSQLFQTMMEEGASDIHLSVGSPPGFRIHGRIVRAKTGVLKPEDTERMCLEILSAKQRERFLRDKELDFAIGVGSSFRLRVNYFYQRGTIAAVFRRIPNEIPKLETLGLSRGIQDLIDRPHGLVLVTGATGSGKSTTLASMIDRINQNHRYHIITIEDPVEYTHSHRLSIVNQREVGTDCHSFSKALRQVLREDPDVILIGEMRDRETAEEALRAAETGHLVFSTMHTGSAVASITRFIQMFPVDVQEYIQSILSYTLEGIVTQVLCKRADKKGRVMIYEYMAITPAIRNLIRENKLHQLYGQVQVAQEQTGSITLNQNLATHIKNGIITYEEAAAHSYDLLELQRILEKLGVPVGGRKVA